MLTHACHRAAPPLLQHLRQSASHAALEQIAEDEQTLTILAG